MHTNNDSAWSLLSTELLVLT